MKKIVSTVFFLLLLASWRSADASAASLETATELKNDIAAFNAEFRSIPLGNKFLPLAHGFEQKKGLVSANGIQVPAYYKHLFFRDMWVGAIIVSVVSEKVATKAHLMAVADKIACDEAMVSTVETFQDRGIAKWTKTTRANDQMPAYETSLNGLFVKVTCRMKNDVWIQETAFAIEELIPVIQNDVLGGKDGS